MFYPPHGAGRCRCLPLTSRSHTIPNQRCSGPFRVRCLCLGKPRRRARYAANKPGAQIRKVTVTAKDLAKMKQIHVEGMQGMEAQRFVDQFSSLYCEGLPHGFDYITRPTARSMEHDSSSNVFNLLRWR